MEDVLSSFSNSLAGLVARAGKSAVAIEARHRIGSSGFLWKPGVIVTVDHATRREEEIPVILPDGNRASAQLVGRDQGTDIAVLRTGNDTAVPALTPPPNVAAGHIVVAVGRHEPGTLAAMGIVSTAAGAWKNWRGGQLDSLIRLDIGAYARSSGSLIADTEGRFVGMLTTGLTRTAPVAVPAATIDRVVTELLEHGRIARGYLGVGLQPVLLPPVFAASLNRNQRTGAMVLSLEPDGPADNGGVLLGDVIVEIASNPIGDTDDVQTALRGATGKDLPVIVLRGGQRVELTVRPGERKN